MCFACMYACAPCISSVHGDGLQRQIPWDCSEDSCEPHCGCQESNLRSLEEQPVLLTSSLKFLLKLAYDIRKLLVAKYLPVCFNTFISEMDFQQPRLFLTSLCSQGDVHFISDPFAPTSQDHLQFCLKKHDTTKFCLFF